MADEAQQILQKMRREREKSKANPEDFYAKLRIYKGRRRALLILNIGSIVMLSGIISACLHLEQHWMTIIGPSALFGGIITLFPITEEWIYSPWQSSSRKYERHFTEH